MIEPLVSVIIPSYNSARWLPDTITSILNQTYKNIEIIVVDDGSTDNTYEVVSHFKDVIYLKNDINCGECITSGRGFKAAKGDYLCRLSSDDMYINQYKIEHQVKIMEDNITDWSYNSINLDADNGDLNNLRTVIFMWLPIPMYFSNKRLQIFDNIVLKFPYIAFLLMCLRNPVNSSTLMIRKSSYMKALKWDDCKHRTDCDGFLLFNFFLQRYKCIAIAEVGSFYRRHPNQASYIIKGVNRVMVKIEYSVSRLRKYFDAMCSLYAILFLFVQTYLLLFPLFFLAFRSEMYQSVLSINQYGEANIEMIFWIMSFPFIVYGVWLNCRNAIEKFDKQNVFKSEGGNI